MKIKTSQLKETLAALKAGLSGGKETTDQSTSFVFDQGMIYTYNDDISIRMPFPDKSIHGSANAKELIALANKVKGDEIDVEIVEEKSELRLKSGRSKAGIKLDAEIRMPLDEIKKLPNKQHWYFLPKEFKEGLKSTLFSTSSEMDEIIFTAVNCRENRMESTDNDRATRWTILSGATMDFLLPADAGKFLIQYKELVSWAVTEGWLHFKVKNGEDEITFSCRTFEGEFPDLTPHFEVEGFMLIFPDGIKDVLDRAGVFTDAEFAQDQLISISVDQKGVMTVRAEGDNGWFEETVRLRQHTKQDFSFQINPQYLSQILNTVGSAIVGSDRVLFSTEKFQHVVALVAEQ